MTTNLIIELQNHLEKLSERLGPLRVPLRAYVAGGIAVNYHTGHRMSDDVDIKWSHRVGIPPDLQIFDVPDPDDPSDVRFITMDGSFSDVFGSFPPDWEDNAPEVAESGDIIIHVMDPTDLAVSKVARFQDRDREDIRQLALHGLIDPEIFATRMQEALDFYVGDTTFIQHNAADAIAIVKDPRDASPPKP